MSKSKKVLSLIIAFVIVLAMMPAVFAENTEVNLLKDDNGALKEGTYITFYGGEYNVDSRGNDQENAYDGDSSTSWTSKWSPAASAYIQANFSVAQQITKIKVKMSSADYFRDYFKVLVSNDADFKTATEVHNQGANVLASGEWLEVDMASFTDKYKYVRVIRSSLSYNFINISEFEVYGYEEALPDSSDCAVLTDRADVTATNSNHLSGSFYAQKTLDGNTSTGSFATRKTDVFVQVDLKRAAPIRKIGFLNYLSDYVSTRVNFDILVSNDANFEESVLLYSRNYNDVGAGNWVYAYGKDETPYRYVRIQKNANSETKSEFELTNYHQFLCIAEIKVWGTEAQNLTVTDLAKTSTVTASSEGTPANQTIDGNVSSDNYWLNWNETGKASITYTFDEPEVVTSVMILPLNDTDRTDRIKNINILGSKDGTFEDAKVLYSITEDMKLGQFNTFTCGELDAYKAIRLEKFETSTSNMGMGFIEVKVIKDSSDFSAGVVKTIPQNGDSGVTNIETTENAIEIQLNRNVNQDTLNAQNIVITNKKTGEALTNINVCYAEGNTFKVDLATLSSNTEYEVKLTQGIKTGDYPLASEYIFSFTTGEILNAPYKEGKIIKNVALGKEITGNAYAPDSRPLSQAVDGIAQTDNFTYGDPKMQINLGNYYDVVALELYPNTWDEHKALLQGMKILGSRANLDIMNITSDEVAKRTIATYPADSTTKETFVFDGTKRLQYIGLYRAETYVVVSEVKVYAYVSEELGDWSVTKDDASVEEITDAGEYVFNMPVTNYVEDADYYMLIGAYDASGAMIGLMCETVTAVKGEETVLSKAIKVDERANVLRAMLIKDKDDARTLTQIYELNKIQ